MATSKHSVVYSQDNHLVSNGTNSQATSMRVSLKPETLYNLPNSPV